MGFFPRWKKVWDRFETWPKVRDFLGNSPYFIRINWWIFYLDWSLLFEFFVYSTNFTTRTLRILFEFETLEIFTTLECWHINSPISFHNLIKFRYFKKQTFCFYSSVNKHMDELKESFFFLSLNLSIIKKWVSNLLIQKPYWDQGLHLQLHMYRAREQFLLFKKFHFLDIYPFVFFTCCQNTV